MRAAGLQPDEFSLAALLRAASLSGQPGAPSLEKQLKKKAACTKPEPETLNPKP